MRIDYYHFADCTRFRIPAVNITSVEEDLKALLARSFDQGISADYALEQAINNPQLITALASQVAENLGFQRQNALERVSDEAQKDAAAYQQKQQAKIQSIEGYLNPIVDEKKKEYAQIEKKVEEKTGYYSAAQRSLEEMRARVQQRLAEVGGVEGYHKIEKINASLQSKPEQYTQIDPAAIANADNGSTNGYQSGNKLKTDYLDSNSKSKKKKKKDLEKALAIATATKKIDPLRDQASLDELVNENASPEEDGALETRLGQPKENSWKSFWKKVWKIANYKIW